MTLRAETKARRDRSEATELLETVPFQAGEDQVFWLHYLASALLQSVNAHFRQTLVWAMMIMSMNKGLLFWL